MIHTIEQGIELIKRFHHGQVDKGGKPYFLHPVAVMELLGEDASTQTKFVALLHDVLEDTEITENHLYTYGFTESVIEAVKLVSKMDNDSRTYLEWIKDIKESGNKLAIDVKIADITHNSSPARLEGLTGATLKKHKEMNKGRYRKALRILKGIN